MKKSVSKLIAIMVIVSLIANIRCVAVDSVEETQSVNYTFCGFCSSVNSSTRTANDWYWSKNNLNVYCVELSEEEELAVETALAIWKNVSYGGYTVNFTFNLDCSYSESDIIINKEYLPIDGETNERPIATTRFNESAMGLADLSELTPGEINKAKISLSRETDRPFSFGTAEAETYDFASTVLHELGHALGIAHCHEKNESCSYECSANVMNPNGAIGATKMVLQDYDKASLVVVYCFNHQFLQKS